MTNSHPPDYMVICKVCSAVTRRFSVKRNGVELAGADVCAHHLGPALHRFAVDVQSHACLVAVGVPDGVAERILVDQFAGKAGAA